MKKNRVIKYLVILIMVIYLSITMFSVTFAAETKEKIYKQREVKPSFLDGVAIYFQDLLYFDGENYETTDEQKQLNTNLVIGMCGFLVVYWLGLLLLFEKEETYNYTYDNSDDIETLNKYDPLIAGCIVDNRQVLPRDILAVILNLIKKGYVNMEMVPNKEIGEEDYFYMVSVNKNNKEELSPVEGYIMSWVFGFYEEEKVDLIKKVKELTKRKDFVKNMEKLNNIAEIELNKKGANIQTVPKYIRIINVIISIAVVILSILHITTNGVNVQVYHSTIMIIFLVSLLIFIIIPLVAFIIHLILMLIVWLKKIIKNTSEIYSGKKIVEMSAITFFFMFMLIGIMYLIIPNKYICLDLFMISMSILIVRTDNLMTKHSKEILNDYYALNEIKYRIEEYSLIKDEQINYIKLWDEYLIYAVAFGIPIPIVKKLRSSYKEDEDLKYLAKCEGLYYISKAYLEVMWEMDFEKSKRKKAVKNFFKQNFSNNKNDENEETIWDIFNDINKYHN